MGLSTRAARAICADVGEAVEKDFGGDRMAWAVQATFHERDQYFDALQRLRVIERRERLVG